MKRYLYEVVRVPTVRGIDLDELNALGKKGYHVVSSDRYNNDLVLLLEKETEETPSKAKKESKEPSEG